MIDDQYRNCLACGSALKGRSDKKYCHDYCRNAYHNQKRSAQTWREQIRSINRTLWKNRQALERLLPPTETEIRVHRDQLLESGFRFRFLTHTLTGHNSTHWQGCYDLAILPIGNNQYLVARRPDPHLL
ncbi:MAG: hypothetical protein RJA57_1022 [Bacteroidota bacterium]|jgi:hypothetical protein